LQPFDSRGGFEIGSYTACPRPNDFGVEGQQWHVDGGKVDTNWVRLDNPFSPKDHISQIVPLLHTCNSSKYCGYINEGFYLSMISNDFGAQVLSLGESYNEGLNEKRQTDLRMHLISAASFSGSGV